MVTCPVGAGSGVNGQRDKARALRYRHLFDAVQSPIRLAEDLAVLDNLSGGRGRFGHWYGLCRTNSKALVYLSHAAFP